MLCACSGPVRDATPEPVYIPDESYYLLMAEIAVQRKAWLTAARQYLQAAALSPDPELARRATDFATGYGYETVALGGARRWLELESDNLVAHAHAGRLYLRRYDTDRAYPHLRALLGDLPDDETFLSLAADLAAEDNTAGVTAVFKRLARQYPDSAGLQLALARSAMRSGDYELALLAAHQAGSEQKRLLESQLLIAQALMALGREAAALKWIENLRDEPASIMVELEYVSLLSAAGRVEQANEQLESLANVYGIQPDFVRVHALVNLAAGDLDTAAQDFHKLLSAGKNVYECFYYLGRIATHHGAYRDGIDYFARVRGEPYLLPAQIAATQAYQKLDERQAALDGLQAFTQDYPRHALAMSPTRAQLLFELGDTQQALATFDDLLDYQPDSIELLLAYGTMLDLAGQRDQSLVVMRRAAELAPMDANVLNALGYTLANRTRRYDEAYLLIRQALELKPDSPAIIDSMGWVLYRLGRDAEALSYLELAYALMDDPEVIAHLGELLWVTGEADNARELLDRSLSTYPDHELLVETRARLPQ
jgi:tetratricopeptide (TPR) repeat protein